MRLSDPSPSDHVYLPPPHLPMSFFPYLFLCIYALSSSMHLHVSFFSPRSFRGSVEWREIRERSVTQLHELIWDERVSMTARRCRLSRPVGRTDDNYPSCCFTVWNDGLSPSWTRCCWVTKHVAIMWKYILHLFVHPSIHPFHPTIYLSRHWRAWNSIPSYISIQLAKPVKTSCFI